MSSESPPEQPLPEFKREHGGGLPWVGIIVIIILTLAGLALVGFALFAGQGESENRAINSTVAAVLAFTATPSNTLPPVTLASTSTPEPAIPIDTAVPPTVAPVATDTVAPPTLAPTNTRPAQPIAVPTDTPLPPTNTPAPAFGAHGISGSLQLCDPGKTTYAAKAVTAIGLIERVCIVETIQNHTSQTVTYGILGVFAQNTSGGSSQFQTSWRGDLKINGGCTGPSGDGGCGGSHTDTGFFIDQPGSYVLTLRICYSNVDTCLGSSGDWETLTSGVEVTVISWTPSP
ncbi:MAG: hypothetical protein AAB658_01700 [Chloroflexota bacterium]